jgi:hypothetical protein
MQPTGLAAFVARIFSNKYRDSFVTRLGVSLFLTKMGITGPLADLLGQILRGVVGMLIEDGTFLIDVSLDSYREGQKIPEFERLATEAYLKASKKVYTEAEKDEIRQQYLKILARIVPVGNGPRR